MRLPTKQNFDFGFQPAAVAPDQTTISPLTLLPPQPEPFGVPQEVFDPHANVDPSMPPLVERPYDPLTDGYYAPAMLDPAQYAGPPRLSINTLDKFAKWEAEYQVQDGPAPSSEPPSPWDNATPPPLSANSAFDFASMPGTPADGYNWPATQHAHQSMPMPQALLPPVPEFTLDQWASFGLAAPTALEPATYSAMPAYEYPPTPVSAHTPAFSPTYAKSTPDTPSFQVNFDFNYRLQQHPQHPISPVTYAHPHPSLAPSFF
jgi:hypothetical protein